VHAAFARECDADLRTLGVPEWQRAELIAIAALETGWGTSAAYQAGNVGGLKAKRDVAEWYRKRWREPLPWFRTAGHTASGDKPVVMYAAFPARSTCWRLLLERTFGTPIAAPYAAAYRETARRLWAGDPDWIAALIAAGYRGTVTAQNPGPSIAAHRSLVTRVRGLLAT
jgi:hypothetical protein